MGRLRKKPWADAYLKKSKIVFLHPKKNIKKWNKKFKNTNPIWIELGIGKGMFTIDKAQSNKNINILGIEKFPSVLVTPVKKAEILNLSNLKFISSDAADIENWFLENSIDKIFINFPDPWPKKSHAKRRLLYFKFLNQYYKILKSNSKIEFKTDQLPLFEFTLEEIREKTNFKIKNISWDLHKEKKNISMTEYETKFSSQGNKIYYAEFQKN